MTDPSPFRSADFWVAVAIALIVKIKTTSQLGPIKVITIQFRFDSTFRCQFNIPAVLWGAESALYGPAILR